ncbi:MAG: sodium/solute symporter, partial [Gammaproteobacteria bacterium]|nr:sodium/solute symporter [Gammaproteobacteria bacterium]
TDMVQLFVLLGGAIAVTLIGLNEVGGWGALKEAAGPEYFSLWKPMSDPDFPWTGILFGAPILGVWYWCTDQFIVQRVLAAQDRHQARRGTIFAALLKQTPLFIFVVPGIIAFVLLESGVLTFDKPDQALPALIGALLPPGLRGLVAAGLLAALMSSLSSVFNSCSTLITIDIFKRFAPDASERMTVNVGRVATVALVLCGLAWIPFMKFVQEGQLFLYLQSVQAYISPPIAAVFLIGVFWSRANSRGAVASLTTGFVLGIARLLLEMNKDQLSGFPAYVAEVNFLHYAIFLFIMSSAALVLFSLTAPRPDRAQIEDLTFETRRVPPAADSGADPRWRRHDASLSVIVLLIIGIVWVYFS